MIFGLSRNLVIAVVIAVIGAGAGLWYILSEDETSAPLAQRESVSTQEATLSQPEARAPEEAEAADDAEPDMVAEVPSGEVHAEVHAEVQGEVQGETQPGADAHAEANGAGVEDVVAEGVVAEDVVSEDEADLSSIETLIEEEVAALTDPATSAPSEAPLREADADQPRLPAFDTIRVEPTGEAVIAGRDAPEGDVVLLRDGEVYDETIAGPSGAFVFIPEPFPVGVSDVTLRATDAQGNVLLSRESVTIIVDADRTRMPMVALTAPGRPTEVLSRPEPIAVAEAVTQETVTQETVTQEMASQAATTRDTAEPDAEPEATALAEAPTEPTAEQPPEIASGGEEQPTAEIEVAAVDSDPEPAAERAGVRIVAVEAETGGGLFVSGEAEAEAAIRLYLNDTLVARAEADAGGDVSFAIRRGVRSGHYQVRLDDVDPATGTVLSRAEVGFTVPEAVAALPEPQPAPAATQPSAEGGDAPTGPVVAVTDEPTAGAADPVAPDSSSVQDRVAEGVAEAGEEASGEVSAEPDSERTEATVVVPELATALVERGDSLWRISRQVYGRGIRYTEIFEANQDQIRNPNLIFPGQVFVLPPDQELGATLEAPPAQ